MPHSQKWINILKGNVTEPLEKRSEKDIISLHKLFCRSATKFFVKSKFATAERRRKTASLKEHTIQLIYSLPFNVTKDTRLFQYKIILRDSIKEQEKCYLCGERQTLTHLFVTAVLKLGFFLSLFSNWWSSIKGDRIRQILELRLPSWLKPLHDYSQMLSIYSLKKRRRVLFRCFLSDVDK